MCAGTGVSHQTERGNQTTAGHGTHADVTGISEHWTPAHVGRREAPPARGIADQPC